MAVTAKDGTTHHSASRARFHDDMATEKTAKPMSPGMAHPADTKTPIEEHVGLHGPATKMDYEHDEGKGMHHVTSHHGEGEEKMHHSTHKSHEAAHEHMGKAMGMSDEEEQEEKDNESPDEQYESSTQSAMPGVDEA